MENKNIEVEESGLKCDNCDWNDSTITFENYKEYLNKPCPKCGTNLLTEEDFKNAETLRLILNFINSLSKEEMDAICSTYGIKNMEDIKNLPLFEGASGLETITNDSEKVSMKISTHGGIKCDEIKNDN